MDVNASLKAARVMAGLTQAEAARRAGMDRAALCRLEQGPQLPSIHTAMRLADLYGLSVDSLLGREGKTAPLVPGDGGDAA